MRIEHEVINSRTRDLPPDGYAQLPGLTPDIIRILAMRSCTRSFQLSGICKLAPRVIQQFRRFDKTSHPLIWNSPHSDGSALHLEGLFHSPDPPPALVPTDPLA